MAEHSRGPDDIPDRQAIRFGLRGEREIVDCFVSWEALDRLEVGPAANRAERLERFEKHRPVIEAAVLAKCGKGDQSVTIEPGDLNI